MLSYRHSFHAGNHADVLKHIVQLLILQSLKQKEKGFLYLDTHSGTGRYSLFSAESEKTSEYLEGVARLWERDDLPEEVALYIDELKKINRGGKLKYYAGSPLLAVNQLRPQDRAILTELHPNDFPLLRQEFAKIENVQTKRENGFQQLKSALPPKERRGFVLIDPPYDLSEADLTMMLTALARSIDPWLAPGAVVVVERSFRSPEPTWPKRLERFSDKRYGESVLWFAEPAPMPDDPGTG